MWQKLFLVLVIVLGVSSCKSKKVNASLPNYSVKTLLKKYDDHRFQDAFLKANISVKYKGKADVPNLNASLRIAKDSVIWMSFSKLGFPVGKIMIEPNRVRLYEKINKSYFDGDFSLLSKWIGTELNYNMVQNLFFAEAIYSPEEFKWRKSRTEGTYELELRKDHPIFHLIYQIDPTGFKLAKEQILAKDSAKKLTVLYNDYRKINESLLPKQFVIFAAEEEEVTSIEVNFKNGSIPATLKFPFKIPANYDRIELAHAKKQ